MSTRINFSKNLVLPLPPVRHCIQHSFVPLAADVFNLPDRSCVLRGLFFVRSVDNPTFFPEGVSPGEIEDEISAG